MPRRSRRDGKKAGFPPFCFLGLLEIRSTTPHVAPGSRQTETRAMIKRVFLFIATNLAVLVLLSVVLNVLGVDRYLTANGLDVGTLLVFSAIVGFTGSIF